MSDRPIRSYPSDGLPDEEEEQEPATLEIHDSTLGVTVEFEPSAE